MIRILTKKESDFLNELAALTQKYDVLFSASGQQEGISLTVFDGESTENELLCSPIQFQKSFDESDISELLEETAKRVKQLKEEYRDIQEYTDNTNESTSIEPTSPI